MTSKALAEAISCFDEQYKEKGMRSQRSYPNDSLIQFIASRYFGLSKEQRRAVRVLEIGSGSGANLWMIAKEGMQAFGIDSSSVGLELAKKHLEEKWGVTANLKVGSFTDLPFDEGFFDVVIDIVSLQHLCLVDSKQALSEVRRVLKPNGEFFSYRLSDHSVMYEHGGDERIDAATLTNISDPSMPIAGNGPTSFWSPSLARMYYEEAGFSLNTVERVGRTYGTGAFAEYLALTATPRS